MGKVDSQIVPFSEVFPDSIGDKQCITCSNCSVKIVTDYSIFEIKLAEEASMSNGLPVGCPNCGTTNYIQSIQ